MEPLIVVSKTEIAGSLAQTVNERDLHQFLGVDKDYSTWIRLGALPASSPRRPARAVQSRRSADHQDSESDPDRGSNES